MGIFFIVALAAAMNLTVADLEVKKGKAPASATEEVTAQVSDEAVAAESIAAVEEAEANTLQAESLKHSTADDTAAYLLLSTEGEANYLNAGQVTEIAR